jgi:hypothetical protein
MTEEKLPQLLCKSKLSSGEYDDLIKERMKSMILAIMQKSGGRENPIMVIDRIKKAIGEFNYSVVANADQPRESVELSGTDENFHEFIGDEPVIFETDELYNADPNCKHETYCAPGGGVKCKHCPGWFCF